MFGLGKYVRDCRHALGLTQSEIERAFGIPQTYLSSVERGTTVLPSAEFRSRLAVALQVSTVDLLLAAGEVTRDDLMGWARQAGVAARHDLNARHVRLAQELSGEGDDSPRCRLAEQIPWMTRSEAEFLLVAFEHLPTEGRGQRARLKQVPEEFRRWRERQDVEGVL